MKKHQDKVVAQAEVKIKTIDDTRKGAELQIEVLTRTNGELLSRFSFVSLFLEFHDRLQMEKESLRQCTSEIENLQTTVKKLQEQIKQVECSFVFLIYLDCERK
jgi:hypothetical protein